VLAPRPDESVAVSVSSRYDGSPPGPVVTCTGTFTPVTNGTSLAGSGWPAVVCIAQMQPRELSAKNSAPS
jgi:hypothetical protein